MLLSDNGENLQNKQEQHFRFVRMGNVPVLLPNATPLVGRFFVEISKKHQQCAFRFRQSLQTFTVIVSNNFPRISGKMRLTIEEKAFSLRNGVNGQPIKRLCIASIIRRTIKVRQTLR
jgi:hypothetical protein